jgi:hypothetical protein
MTRLTLTLIAATVNALAPDLGSAQSKHYPLASAAGLRVNNVIATPITHKGKKGLRVEAAPGGAPGQPKPLLVPVDALEFSNGVIEVEIAGAPPPAAEGARGFVGIAFRVQPDNNTYDAFYLRPTNGRAEDQERRNHATQYISHPDWTWSRLRQETPSKYESYVDLEPDTWTRIRIEVRGTQARLYVHEQKQPALIVNDLKSGANVKGAVALWLEPGTVAHFRNLKVTP